MLIGNHSAGKSSFINWYESGDFIFFSFQYFITAFLRNSNCNNFSEKYA